MNFALNTPALQTAGQILTQQCHAAGIARRMRESGANTQAPGVGDHVLSAITELTFAAAPHRLPMGSGGAHKRPSIEVSLARAVTHIFDLAASQGIDLGTVIAEQLADETTQS